MKVLLMTDLEGVAGVRDSTNWVQPDSRYYDVACRLLTKEANAAIDGFFAGGADYILVADGHGWGGIDIELLDERVDYGRGWEKGWPFGLDETFDGVAWVGQHAKASTEFAHLPHTGSFHVIDFSINGLSVGEFGQLALCGAEFGVPSFFASGDLAFTHEALQLIPGITVCPVKWGLIPGSGEECTVEEYGERNVAAVHIPPARARKMIRASAEDAARALGEKPPALISLSPPFERLVRFRPGEKREPQTISREKHPASVIELLRMPYELAEPLT